MSMTQVTTLSLDSIESFRQWLSDRGRSEHTAKSYASDLQQFLLAGGTSSIDFSDLEDQGSRWLTANRRTLSPKTTGRRLTSLRAFARWAGQPAMFLDYTAPTPLKHIPDPLPEGIEGVHRMLAVAENTTLKVSVALCGLAGLRISEALSLSSDDLDWSTRLITVRGKGDKTRIVPMSTLLADILLEPAVRAAGNPTLLMGPDGGPVGDRLARRSITRLGRRAGLTRTVASHQLRATFATHTLNKTGNIRVVQELLGHADVKTTEGYTAVRIDQMRSAVEGL